MNRYFLSIVFCVSIFTSYVVAQTHQERLADRTALSEIMKAPSNTEIQKIIATEGGGFYALRLKKGSMFARNEVNVVIEYYDGQMKMRRQKEIEMKYKDKRLEFKDVVMIDGKLWLLAYFYNQKQEMTYLFAQRIKNETLTVDKDLVKIAEKKGKNNAWEDVFGVAQSRDSAKIVVYNRERDENKKERYDITVFNADIEALWTRSAVLPYGEKNFEAEEFQVDELGNVYVLGIVYPEGSNRIKRQGKPNYQYVFWAFEKENETPREFKINGIEQFITDLTFRKGNDGVLTFAGFYSEKGNTSIKGTVYFRLNPREKELSDIVTSAFDFDFLTKNLNERAIKRAEQAAEKGDKNAEVELSNYQLDKLIVRNDGGVILVAEQFYIEQRFNNNMNRFASPYMRYDPVWGWYDPFDPYGNRYRNNQRPDYVFNYNDIIVVNIAPTGAIDWSASVPKRQVSINDNGYFSSYAVATIDDRVCFMYNEDPRNLVNNRRTAETPDNNSVVVLAEVSQNGKVKIAPLFGNREEGVIAYPKMCKQIGRLDMLIYGENGRNYRFAKVGLE